MTNPGVYALAAAGALVVGLMVHAAMAYIDGCGWMDDNDDDGDDRGSP